MTEFPAINRVRRLLNRWRGQGRTVGPGVLVAVSGGSDSVALLRGLQQLAPELGLDLTVAHLDHGVRGEAAAADAKFVADLAATLGLPCELGTWSPTRSNHFEADARRARYEWLIDVATRLGANAVAVGHTRDDQAETILHRILRGTGPRGLAGIPIRRPLAEGIDLIRPLRGASRQTLRDWLIQIHQGWREDISNDDTSRMRSRIRHDLLPLLARDYNPKVAGALLRLGRIAATAHQDFDTLLASHEQAAVAHRDPSSLAIRREALAALPASVAVELLRRIWRRHGWPEGAMGARHWRRLEHFVRLAARPESIGGGVVGVPDGPLVHLRRIGVEAPPPAPPPLPLPIPGQVAWGSTRLEATRERSESIDEWIDEDALNLDPEAPALVVRGPRPGDRFDPLGMDGRTMGLGDFLRGRGVGRSARPMVPLVCDGTGIVWVVGHRIAERARISEATRRVIGLCVNPRSGPRASPGR